MKTKIFDDAMSLSRPVSRIERRDSSYGDWLDGEVVTPNGIVTIYSQGGKDSFYHTRLDFSFKNRLYMRNFQNRRFSKQYIVTLSNRFAAEIVNKNNKK